MTEDKFKDRMESEIQKRMQSAEWDLEIASRVASGLKERKKRNLIAAILPSLAAAAAIILAVFFNRGEFAVNSYDQMIQSQLDGIYTEVFKENYISPDSGDQNSASYDNIDLLIDTALSKR